VTTVELSKNAQTVLEKRYLLRDENNKIIETVEEMFDRVASFIATTDEEREEFFELMTSLRFLPNSPTLMNAGTALGQLSACFVLPIEDDMSSIFDAVKHSALIHQCLEKNTLVMTNNGLVEIKDVKADSMIETDEGAFSVSKVYYNGKSDEGRLANATGIIYVDGSLQGTFVYEVCSFWSDQFRYAQMGRNSNDSTEHFDGVIDEFKINKYVGGNEPPGVPTIDGPTTGSPGVEYDYTFVTNDPEEDGIMLQIDWGDGDITEWLGPYNSGEEVTQGHTWIENGTYNIKARSKDEFHESDWSGPYMVIIGNKPPEAPTIDGPTNGKTGEELTYTFVTEDPEENDLYYYINWDDGTYEEWIGPYNSGEEIQFTHSWSSAGIYDISVKARDIYGAESDWGDTWSVEIISTGEIEFEMEIQKFSVGRIIVRMKNAGQEDLSNIYWNLSVVRKIFGGYILKTNGSIERLNVSQSYTIRTPDKSIIRKIANAKVKVNVSVGEKTYEETFYGVIIGRFFLEKSLFNVL